MELEFKPAKTSLVFDDRPLIKKCSTDSDMISMIDWVEKDPDIFIEFKRKDSKNKTISTINCYDAENLSKVLSNPENTFADWIQNPTAGPMSHEGYGGKAGDRRFYKLYTNEYIVQDHYSEGIAFGIYTRVLFGTEYLGKIRLGNTESVFGISMLHGQAPGEDVYKLVPPPDLPFYKDFIKTEQTINKSNIQIFNTSTFHSLPFIAKGKIITVKAPGIIVYKLYQEITAMGIKEHVLRHRIFYNKFGKNGLEETWYPDGKKSNSFVSWVSLDDNQIDIPQEYETWYPNGKLKSEGIDPLLTGTGYQKYFWDNGQLSLQVYFSNFSKDYENRYDKNGNEIGIVSFKSRYTVI